MERLSDSQTRAALELIDQSRQSIDARLPNSKGKKSSAHTSTNDKLGPLSNALQELANVLQERDDLCTALAGMNRQTVATPFEQLVLMNAHCSTCSSWTSLYGAAIKPCIDCQCIVH
jgi:hypothetical protein